MIDSETLRALLNYDPETGLFHWKVRRGPAVPGAQAGHLSAEGYVVMRHGPRSYKAHRLAWLYMTGSFPDGVIDHENRIKSDNRWVNLRLVSDSQSAQNKGLTKANTSGYKGVSWKPRINKWVAQISWRGKVMHLGCFSDPKEAARTYALAAAVYHTHNSVNEVAAAG